MVFNKGLLRVISFILLFILGTGIFKSSFNSYLNVSHEFSYLDFGHVHSHSHSHSQSVGASSADEHGDCHGSMVSGFVFIPVTFDPFADLLLNLKVHYTPKPNLKYQNPYSDPIRKPPRFS